MRQSVFSTAVNPMDDDQSMEEIRCDLDKPTIAPYKNTWRPHQKYSVLVQLKLAQKRGLHFYQTRSHAIVVYSTLPAICIEKAVSMKTKEELYNKVYLSPMVATCCTESEVAKWTTRSTRTRRKNIL